MIVFPPCKINLGLFVTGKRADGFHSLESLFVPVPLTDILEVVLHEETDIFWSSSGLDIPGEKESNLCVRAYRLLQRDFGIGGVKAHLHKLIPMGAGLGGGSSDAAYMLMCLNELFELNLSSTQLKDYAAQLGSDCPFFIEEKTCFVSGRGEVLEAIDFSLKGKYIVIIHPHVHVSTAEAYGMLTPKEAPFNLKKIESISSTEWMKLITNDFEAPIAQAHPIIAEVKKELLDNGAFYAAMSGSGSAVFGFFDEEVKWTNKNGLFQFSTKL